MIRCDAKYNIGTLVGGTLAGDDVLGTFHGHIVLTLHAVHQQVAHVDILIDQVEQVDAKTSFVQNARLPHVLFVRSAIGIVKRTGVMPATRLKFLTKQEKSLQPTFSKRKTADTAVFLLS